MPEATPLDEITDELYATNPDDFVPTRGDAVARAKDGGDRNLARAVARLRRPTKAAWLVNLLARHRTEQLDGLLALAGDLADAQRTLDGATLRALSSQRNRLVAAMAREAGRLASQAGDSAGDSVIREVAGILEAALADPAVAEEVRAGRLTRTVSYSGFGPVAEPGTVSTRPAPATPAADPAPPAQDLDTDHQTEQERVRQEWAQQESARRERRAAERDERHREAAEAEAAEARARDRHEADEAARGDAEQDHADARTRVADLAAELDEARERERAAATAAREAGVTARESARVAAGAATTAARARAHRDELDP